MFYYLAVLIFIVYLPVATLTIECMECDQELELNSSAILNTTRPECQKMNKASDMCLAMLIIDFEDQTASAYLSHLPDQSLTFSNGRKMMINTMLIWFNKDIVFQSVSSMAHSYTAVVEDTKKIYDQVKTLKYQELRTKLMEQLYIPLLANADLACSDNEGKSVACRNGFCQLTGSETSVDRKCVPQGPGVNPEGIQIVHTSTEESDNTTIIIYACNKDMCNGADTDGKVRQLLNEYGLPSVNSSLPQIGSSAMARSHQTMMSFQWVLLLLMTSLFKI